MLKLSAPEVLDSSLSYKLQPVIKKLMKLIRENCGINIFSEDMIYKWNFIKHYMPELYKRHTLDQYKNCIFCANLTGKGCSRHCLKCSAGTYVHGGPLLPGTLNNETYYPNSTYTLSVPWYYKKTCERFTRLPQEKYLKNFGSIFGSAGIFNYEVLEGLEKGLSSGERPCHVCAVVNYEIYKNCSMQKDFEKYIPCSRITGELSRIYTGNNQV